jgi:hypothetical protein
VSATTPAPANVQTHVAGPIPGVCSTGGASVEDGDDSTGGDGDSDGGADGLAGGAVG